MRVSDEVRPTVNGEVKAKAIGYSRLSRKERRSLRNLTVFLLILNSGNDTVQLTIHLF